MQKPEAFVGRSEEMAVLSRLLAEAREAGPRTLVVEGEAGIGKTTLVEQFIATRPDARVLRASGDESELGIAFAVVDQLLRSVGVESPGVLGAGQHLAVGLQLLNQLAGDGGQDTIVFVDDAHLADADSLRALLFCVRRLPGSATLFVLTVRGWALEALPEGWLKRAGDNLLRPRALTTDDGRALANQLGMPLTFTAAARLVGHTSGNPLYLLAVLRDLPPTDDWRHEDRSLPVPSAYAQLIVTQLSHTADDVVKLLSSVAVLGVRAPTSSVLTLAQVDDPLAVVDRAVDTGLVRVVEGERGTWIEFKHPLTRAAVHDAMPQALRHSLHQTAAELASSAEAALHHRVEAETFPDAALQHELEVAARAASERGAWSVAIKHLLAAVRVASEQSDRERLTLEAIDALLYSGDGGAARRLAARTTLAPSARRDSVFAYLAWFAGELDAAETLLERAWTTRGTDTRLAATIAQRRALLAGSRFRGADAIEWARLATSLVPEDTGTALLAAPSLVNGLTIEGRVDEAHAELDRWLEDRDSPARGSGYILSTLKARLLEAHGDLTAAEERYSRSAEISLAEGLLVIASMSLAGLARVHYLSGTWDDSIVASERAVAVAVESEDAWVVALAQVAASRVASARGDWASVERLHAEVAAVPARIERHVALQQLFAAQVASARQRPADVLSQLARLAAWDADFGLFPWHHLYAHALLDLQHLDEAEAFITATEPVAEARRYPLLTARLGHARARLVAARRDQDATAAFTEATALVAPLGMPYERALVDLAHGQYLRRERRRRAASNVLSPAREVFEGLGALPALRRCEQELAACGLAPASRARKAAGLTPQETAVTRLVASGLTNREVAAKLMLSTKTVEFHLGNAYNKLGVRSRVELRARARDRDLALTRETD